MRLLLAVAACLLVPAPALAGWREASSDHFVIYADDSARDLQRLSEYLERYHAAMEMVSGKNQPKPTPSNRVTIYVVDSEARVRRLKGDNNRFVAGFYVPQAGNTRAFVPKFDSTNGRDNWSLTVLMHEYAHHFLIANRIGDIPRWMEEGAAEFYASTTFDSDGGVSMGLPAKHRASELQDGTKVPIRALLDDRIYQANRGKDYDSYYGRAWLLFHYLTFAPERKGQLRAYGDALAKRMAPLAAAEQVFGDLDKLDRELERYRTVYRMTYVNIPADKVPTGPVKVSDLSAGMDAMMPLMIRSKAGVDETTGPALAVEVRAVAARFPGDAGVMAALAEAEFDAGNDDAAITAADRAVALDPAMTNAYVQKGYALFRRAGSAPDQDKAYAAAMVPFGQLNRMENDHPLPLIYYYRSFADRGKAPPEPARHALERAAMLAPFDKDLWMTMVMMLAGEGKNKLAASFMQALASNPHDQNGSRRAAILMEQIAATREGVPFRPDWNALEAAVKSETRDAAAPG